MFGHPITIIKSKIIIEKAFHDYNNIIHSTLDYYSPLQFLDKWNNDNIFREYYIEFLKNFEGWLQKKKT